MGLTDDYIHESGRDWLADCFPDDEDAIRALTNAEVERAVERHYEGGWSEFVRDEEYAEAEANYPGGWRAYVTRGEGWPYAHEFED